MGYSVVNVGEIEPSGPGGAVRFVRGSGVIASTEKRSRSRPERSSGSTLRHGGNPWPGPTG
jgi:hypothetical protein